MHPLTVQTAYCQARILGCSDQEALMTAERIYAEFHPALPVERIRRAVRSLLVGVRVPSVAVPPAQAAE